MKKTGIHLTKSEEALMELFWEKNIPLTSIDILGISQDQPWNDSYLHIMLRSLLKKDVIKICNTIQYGTQYARQFIPTLSREDYAAKLIMSKGFEHKSVAKVMVAMAKEANYDKDLVEQLEAIAATMKEKEPIEKETKEKGQKEK